MKTLLILSSIVVMAAGCAHKNKEAGAPPAPVATESGYGESTQSTGYQPGYQPGLAPGWTTQPQPGVNPVNGLYPIQAPTK